MTANKQVDSRNLVSLEHCSIVMDGKIVLDDVSFVLREGERWALIGHNGSGKTLFLKLLRGDMWPTPDVTGLERREYDFDGDSNDQPAGFKERIAYVGPENQDRYVRYDWNHSVERVVTTGVFAEDIPRTIATPTQRRRVQRLLKQFRVWSLRERGFLTLSYGQRRRALVARGLAGDPKVLLLDEVFNGLDALSAGVLRKALDRKRGPGSTWIVTTHRSHDVPKNATRFAKMENGRLTFLPSKPAPQPSPATGRAGPKKSIPLLGEGKRSAGEGRTLVSLRAVDLYRDYRSVLRNVNWTIRRGEHWAVMGANGSGKSSLLKLIYGDLHAKLGGIVERDRVPFGTPISAWKRRVGFVSPELQADYFLAKDLEEVVVSGRYSSIGLNDPATRSDRRAAKQWLKFFRLEDLAHRGPREVSYGQMRRALLARAMINNPELLLLDEPCTGLDPESRVEVLALLERLTKRGVQLVMAVHDKADLPPAVTRLLTIGRDRRVVITARSK